MALILSSKQHRQLLNWAEDAGGHECCGLLLGENAVVHRVELAANVASDTRRHFEIDPSALIAAEKKARHGGFHILGYFHSHPNGLAKPSDNDAANAVADGRLWLIIASTAISAWLPVANGKGILRFEPYQLVVEG